MSQDGDGGTNRRKRLSWAQLRRIWMTPVLVLAGATTLMLGVPFAFDWVHRPDAQGGLNPIQLVLNYDLETLQNALGNLAQTVAALLGILITVVAIVVQLAATRYTPRVTELFLRERTNFLVLGFFVASCVMAIWVSLSVGNGFLPKASVVASVVATSLCLLLMIPYFVWVFDFLDPEKVVSRIQDDALEAASMPIGNVEKAQTRVLDAVENLADIAVAAVGSQDKIISARAVDAMRQLMVSYIGTKTKLPPAWSHPGERVRENPDFVSMDPEALQDLVQDNLWLEWKVLRQYQAIYSEALKDNPDMNYLLAIDTRYLGEAAIDNDLDAVIELVLKFFNTYMRATLNKKQVRTAYNVMNQYRQLVEAIVRSGRHGLVSEIAAYFRYYGQIANGLGLGFVTETIAYDLATLCELSHREESQVHDALLASLLELDREAESEAQEAALRGVRKAQLRLATYYLLHGDEAAARRIHVDMKHERPERLVSIRNELMRIKSKDFWEVIDRGANFDYMNDERKAQLRTFFSWFPWSSSKFKVETSAVKSPRQTSSLPMLKLDDEGNPTFEDGTPVGEEAPAESASKSS